MEKTCIIPGTSLSCSELVANLPWVFTTDEENIGETHRIVFLCPAHTGKADVQLKIVLLVTDYENALETDQAFNEIYRNSDSDIGLTYGWDFVKTGDNRLYQLHADCVLAEKYFSLIVKAIDAEPSFDRDDLSFACRCGGNCRKL